MSELQQLIKSMGLNEDSKSTFEEWTSQYEESCEELLRYVEGNGNLKSSLRNIPQKIRLPKTLRKNLSVIDVQVHGRRREPDDKIYASDQQIRSKIARGNTLIRYGPSNRVCFPLYGMKKFTGGMGDDDDHTNGGDDHTWKKFFTQPATNATHIVSTSKENGSAGHLTAIFVDGEYVLIGGSKNSHLICSLKHGEEDLKLYKDSPWGVASIIMQCIFDLFNEIGEQKTHEFLSILADYHLTSIWEMLDPNDQHVELLTNPKPITRFITFTDAWSGGSPSENKLCIYPLICVDLMKYFGIPTITCEIFPLSDSEEERNNQFLKLQKSIREDTGNEGKVLYFATKDNEVIGLLKKKTLWYILIRALREKMKGYVIHVEHKKRGKKPRFSSLEAHRDHTSKMITKRLKEIQKWLSFSDEELLKWEEDGQALNEYVYSKLKSQRLETSVIQSKFPVLWYEFVNLKK